MTLGNIVGLGNGIAYDFVKPDLQNLIRLWVHMTSLAQIRPNRPEIAQHEEDHVCCVPHLRKIVVIFRWYVKIEEN